MRGLNSGTVYHAVLYGASKVTDCAAHSYGAPMINYFESHPCISATRRIFTIPVQGRTVALSSVAVVAAAGPGNDYYKWAGRFMKLEKSDGTGSINDLLREGCRIRARRTRYRTPRPSTSSARTTWSRCWMRGTRRVAPRDQDPTLLRLEEDLFLTPLTNPAS